MKYFFFLLSILSVCYLCSAETLYEMWDSSMYSFLPSDRRGALPNDSSEPKNYIPTCSLPSLLHTKHGTIRRVEVPAEVKVVALTFDMCELATKTTGYDTDIINFLRLHQIQATLFLGGKWMRTHSERAMQLIADPLFEIGNHAWTHGNFGIMNEAKMREQILWTQAQYQILRKQIFERAQLKKLPLPTIPECMQLFRLPYGRCTSQALTLLAELGFHVIQWDVVAELHKDNSLNGLEKSIVKNVKSGSIILFHANCVPTGSAILLQRVVEALKHQGYQFVSISKLLTMGEPQYTMEGYFTSPGDNLLLDTQFGIDGTGVK